MAYRPPQAPQPITIIKQIIKTVKKARRPKAKVSLSPEKSALIDKLKQNPCTSCNKRYARRVMDFHHIKFPKVCSISRMEKDSQYSLQDLQKEIDKCILVCSNCHRQSH